MNNSSFFETKLLCKFKGFIQLLRPQFWLPAVGPAVAAIIISSKGAFHITELIIVIFIFTCICAGAEAINDFYDRNFDKPNAGKKILGIISSGGSGVIQNKVIGQRETLIISLILFTVALLSILFTQNALLIFLGLTGIFFAITYSAPPIRWKERGVLAGIVRGVSYGFISFNFGWYMVSSSYSMYPLFIGVLLSLLVIGYGTTADIADYSVDKENGISTLPVSIGIKNAKIFCTFLILTFFASILILNLLDLLKFNFLFWPLFLLGVYTTILMQNKNFIPTMSLVHLIGVLVESIVSYVFI